MTRGDATTLQWWLQGLYLFTAIFGISVTVVDMLGILGAGDDHGAGDHGDHGAAVHGDAQDGAHPPLLSILGYLCMGVHLSLGFGPLGLFSAAVRAFENARENLLAETRVKIATERQRAAVEVQKAVCDAEAQVAGIRAQIEAEHQRVEMLRARYEAELLIPAEAERERMLLQAKTQGAALRGPAQAAIDQLTRTVRILQQGGTAALQAYLIENFEKFIRPFAQMLDLFPVKQATVITGAGTFHPLLSGIHPHPIEEEKARLLQQAFGALATAIPEQRESAAEPVAGRS